MQKILIKVNGGEKEFITQKGKGIFSVIVSNEPRDEARYEVPTAWLENENNIQILKGKHVLVKASELYE